MGCGKDLVVLLELDRVCSVACVAAPEEEDDGGALLVDRCEDSVCEARQRRA